MACKIHAFMNAHLRPLILALAAASALPSTAWAEKADRGKPLNVAADSQGTVDLQKQVVVFNGNVVITKGTIVIKADRVEVREAPDGYRTAVAIGSAGRPATFRQKRDGVDEYIDGRADRLEYDDRADVVRFVNNANVRRLRGSAVADEITGTLITYDNIAELFKVSSGNGAGSGNAASASSGNDSRVRAVLTPREGSPAAAEAAAAASGAAPELQPSRSLGGGR